ncbi:hypothetical protein [Micromonospora sp. DT233]|uniref:hypothetical protein n=1 Tax=Micromonospora sp. DT233 TaxID=3393432 RepID=UPI003CF0BD69
MTGPEPIRPEAAPDAVAFVAMMRQLKGRSGHTFRQLEKVAARHGDYLPRSTTADVLRRQALPRADVLAAFVRACAGEEHVAAWLRARERLAEAAVAFDDARPNDDLLLYPVKQAFRTTVRPAGGR